VSGLVVGNRRGTLVVLDLNPALTGPSKLGVNEGRLQGGGDRCGAGLRDFACAWCSN